MKEKQAQTQNYNIDQLKDMGNNMSSQYGPMFKKYLDKAVQHAQPTEVQGEPGRLVPDPSLFVTYVQSIEKAKKVVEFSKLSNKLLQDLFKKQTELKENYTKYLATEQQLRPYVNVNSQTVLLNEESGDLVNTMNEVMGVIEQNVTDIKNISEEAFDGLQPIGL